jgi:hypothetical protein
MSVVTLVQAAVACLPAATLLAVLWWLDQDPAASSPGPDGGAAPGSPETTATPAGTSQAPSDRRPGRAA